MTITNLSASRPAVARLLARLGAVPMALSGLVIFSGGCTFHASGEARTGARSQRSSGGESRRTVHGQPRTTAADTEAEQEPAKTRVYVEPQDDDDRDENEARATRPGRRVEDQGRGDDDSDAAPRGRRPTVRAERPARPGRSRPPVDVEDRSGRTVHVPNQPQGRKQPEGAQPTARARPAEPRPGRPARTGNVGDGNVTDRTTPGNRPQPGRPRDRPEGREPGNLARDKPPKPELDDSRGNAVREPGRELPPLRLAPGQKTACRLKHSQAPAGGLLTLEIRGIDRSDNDVVVRVGGHLAAIARRNQRANIMQVRIPRNMRSGGAVVIEANEEKTKCGQLRIVGHGRP